MGTLINIADIPIYIKEAGFLKNLTPIEKKLLRPFIYHRSAINEYANPFVVDIKMIKEAHTTNNKPFVPSLVNKVKKQLACPSDHNIRKKLQLYLKIFFYSDENQFKKFIDVLIAMGDSSKVMPGKDSLFIFNRTSRASYVFLHKRHPSTNKLAILKSLFLMIAIEEDGILLHASSVDEKGRGYVFAGPGNSGKSTAARIGGFRRILSDDTTVIRRINHSYVVFSNPWWNVENVDNNIGIPNSGNPVPLKAIFFIKKAKKTGMKKMSLKETLVRLRYSDAIFQVIRFYGTPFEIKKFYLFSLVLSSNIPIFELRIKKGPDFKQEFQSLLCRYVYKNAYLNNLAWLGDRK